VFLFLFLKIEKFFKAQVGTYGTCDNVGPQKVPTYRIRIHKKLIEKLKLFLK
jgi:hypothetical protein